MFKFKNAEKSRFITIFVYFSREAAIFSREIAFVSCEIAISSSTSRKTQKSLKIVIFRLKYTKIVKNRDFTRLNLNISGFTLWDSRTVGFGDVEGLLEFGSVMDL